MKKRNLILFTFVLSFVCGCGVVNDISDPTSNTSLVQSIYEPTFKYEKTSDPVVNLNLEEREFYDNKFFEERIPDEWPSYGVGDPFVYRFNGKYYLYCSTKDNFYGVKGWVSKDMMSWKPMTGEGLAEGLVCNDETTKSAYAPEVFYRNGYFYMCQSQGGNGHYFYKSEKPEGPFIRISENLGESIDGSFFIDDDEKMYFSRASDRGIVIKELDENLNFVDSKTISSTYMNGWTEGSYILKRDGMYYITYTGNHIMSNAYRVSYSYATEQDFKNNYSFNKGNVLLINTDEDFKGLGHSSTVLGPDLDSYYIAYHNLINTIPTRRFNLARLSFNGANMTADKVGIYDNLVPRAPIFSGESKEDLEKTGDLYLTDIQSSDIFSAEFNFIGENAHLYFSYVDSSNYNYIKVSNNTIYVYEVNEGVETLIDKKKLNYEYDFAKLHTVRIACNETLDVYFDNSRKLKDLDLNIKNGLIGYKNNVEICSTTLADVAKGSSDNKEIHFSNISLEDYYYSSSKIEEGTSRYHESKSIILNKKDQEVVYPIFVDEEGNYNFDLVYNKEHYGRKIKFRIDDGDYIVATLQDVADDSSKFIKTTVFNELLEEGHHTLLIKCIDEVELAELFINKASLNLDPQNYTLEELTDLNYISEWSIGKGGHLSKSNTRNIAYIPYKDVTNAVIEVDVTIHMDTGVNDSACGVVLRANNAGLYSTEDQTGIQGYFCGIDSFSAFISKYNFEYSQNRIESERSYFKSGTTHHIKATIIENNIFYEVDGESMILEIDDPYKYSSGYFGIYADNVNAVFNNLKFYTI